MRIRLCRSIVITSNELKYFKFLYILIPLYIFGDVNILFHVHNMSCTWSSWNLNTSDCILIYTVKKVCRTVQAVNVRTVLNLMFFTRFTCWLETNLHYVEFFLYDYFITALRYDFNIKSDGDSHANH